MIPSLMAIAALPYIRKFCRPETPESYLLDLICVSSLVYISKADTNLFLV